MFRKGIVWVWQWAGRELSRRYPSVPFCPHGPHHQCGFAGKTVVHFMVEAWAQPETGDLLILCILMLRKSFLHLYSPGTHRASFLAQCPCSSALRFSWGERHCRWAGGVWQRKLQLFQFFLLLGIVVPQCWGRNEGRAESGLAGRMGGHPLLQTMQWYRYFIVALQVFSKKSVVVVCCQFSPISHADLSASPEYSHYLCGQ